MKPTGQLQRRLPEESNRLSGKTASALAQQWPGRAVLVSGNGSSFSGSKQS